MNGIEQLNKGLQGVFKLLAARNKVLYENSAGWSSGNITVPDADKYSEFDVYLWEMINPVRGHLVNGVIRAAGLVQGITNQAVHASVEINISVNGNVLSFNLANYMIHAATGVHQSIEAMSIKKIIGVEPIPAKILSGGGALLKRVFAPLTGPVRGCLA